MDGRHMRALEFRHLDGPPDDEEPDDSAMPPLVKLMAEIAICMTPRALSEMVVAAASLGAIRGDFPDTQTFLRELAEQDAPLNWLADRIKTFDAKRESGEWSPGE